ncbi:MAG: hypothetical protein LBC33_00140 [Mycoplasmataceae bacterium]|jgi:hypothetical protein|nr:hypothetical protein [Mycoplasmataceae bacterium]
MIKTFASHIAINFNYRLRFYVSNRRRFIVQFRIYLIVTHKFKYLGNNNFVTPMIDKTKLNLIVKKIIERFPFLIECVREFAITKFDDNTISGLNTIKRISLSNKMLESKNSLANNFYPHVIKFI